MADGGTLYLRRPGGRLASAVADEVKTEASPGTSEGPVSQSAALLGVLEDAWPQLWRWR